MHACIFYLHLSYVIRLPLTFFCSCAIFKLQSASKRRAGVVSCVYLRYGMRSGEHIPGQASAFSEHVWERQSFLFFMIVTFGSVPEVPVGHVVYQRQHHKLVVNSVRRNILDPWGDKARASLYQSIDLKELAAADVVYVLIAHVGEWCTRADTKCLFDWIVARRGSQKKVKMVTNFSSLDREIREEEEREIAERKIEVIEVDDIAGQEFFRDIVRQYAAA